MEFSDIGVMRVPMALSFLAVVTLALWSATRVVGARASAGLRTKAWVDAVLFWGGFAAISGALGSLIGIIQALQRIEAAGEVTAPLIAFGAKTALLSSSIGLLILIVASLCWFVLQFRWRLLAAAESAAGGS